MIAKSDQRGWWITTFPTGTRFYPQQPSAKDVHIEDIAHSLPMQARFLGHTIRHYSVGEHSCHVADVIWNMTQDKAAAACGLLHDGEETYVGDMPRPIKHYGPLAAYRSLCGRCTSVILERFGLGEAFAKHEALVKQTDDALLHTESRRLHHGAGWEDDAKILRDVPIEQFSEQEVIDLLTAQLSHDVTSATVDVRYTELVEAVVVVRAKLMQGGAQGRWRREFLERFERWVL